MRKHLGYALALAGLGCVLAPRAVLADTITPLFFDNFESDAADYLNASLVHWTTVSGAVDLLSGGNLCAAAGNSSHCVDLDGTGSSAGTIQSNQSFAVAPGVSRREFDLAGANRPWHGAESNTVTVSFGSYFAEDFTMLQYQPFQTFVRDITVGAGGTANIRFSHHGGDWIGLLLDNVAFSHLVVDVPDEIPDPPIDPNVIPTPEPATWTMLGAALGLLGLGFRRRNR